MNILGYQFEILIIIADASLEPGLDPVPVPSAAQGIGFAAAFAVDHDLHPVCTHASTSLSSFIIDRSPKP
jgi:hypothetical protein